MLKTVLGLHNCDVKLPNRMFLLVALSLTISLPFSTFADTNQGLLRLEDFKDPGSFAVKLQDTRAVVSKSIAVQLSDEMQRLLAEYDGANTPPLPFQKALLTDLNRLLQAGSLYDEKNFAKIELSKETQKLLAQSPKSGDALIRLNRFLLADTYPHELASPTEKQTDDKAKGIETCRTHLRQIKLGLEKYRIDRKNEPKWLSELSPQYINKKMLLCPADTTKGKPEVLTEGASDPSLPCSYLYEFRADEKVNQELLLKHVGDMIPIVRCQHHLLNLSVSGKLYRNGPQRPIYNNSVVKITRTSTGQSSLPTNLPAGAKKIATLHIDPSKNLQDQLKAQLGEGFLETPEGKSLLKQLTSRSSNSANRKKLAHLLDKPMPDIVLMTLAKKPVKLKTLRGKFVLVHLFSTELTPCGPKLQQLEKQFENYDSKQLHAAGISIGGTAKAIKTFKEKYKLSLPIWVGKSEQIQTLMNRDSAKQETELITILLDQELVVKDVFIDAAPESLLQKVKVLIESKD